MVFEDEAHVSTWLIQLSSVTVLNGRTALTIISLFILLLLSKFVHHCSFELSKQDAEPQFKHSNNSNFEHK